MRVLVLGAAAGGGFPQWNCNCGACRQARTNGAQAATQASVAVTIDDRHWFVINAAPDLRQQINDNPQLHPAHGLRSSPIAGVILTNGDVDAVAGLLNLREGTPFTVYAHKRVLAVLDSNSIFNVLNRDIVMRRELVLDETQALMLPDGSAAGLTVEAFAVPGKVALYLEDDAAGANFGTQKGDTIGLAVREPASGKSFYFLSSCAKMTPEIAARLKGAPLVFFDGTLWSDDEMVAAGMGPKTGQRMGHMSMSGTNGSMAGLEGLQIGRLVFIHINNSNPVLLPDSAQRRTAEAAGWEVPYDGMAINL